MRINRQDTNGVKPLLQVGELGYDNYPAGGDAGRVYVGNGASNIALAKKSEVDAKVVANVDITAGTATKVTYDAKGLVVSGTTLSAVDIPVLDAGKITTGTLPVTRGGTGTTTSTGTGSTVLSTSPVLVTPTIGVATGTSFNSITGLSSTTPVMDGTATAGTGVTVARADHVHPKDTTKVDANANITAGTYKSVTVDVKGLVTGGTNPTTLGGYGITDTYTKTETNTQISTAVNGLVDAAPGTLDTLNELAAALGDDPNFATTIANSIGTKVDKVTSTDNAIVRFDGTTGAVQNSSILIDDNGNLNITGTGKKITGDFSNATGSSRTLIQTNATNSNTVLAVIPNGTSTISAFRAYSSPLVDNSSYTQLMIEGANASASIVVDKVGSGSYYPLVSVVGGSERMRIDTSGNVLVTGGGGLGYGTGSGGAVTQPPTNGKATAVTLNKPSGAITMNNAALAAGAFVYFPINNSILSLTDGILITHNDNGLYVGQNYDIKVVYKTNGGFGVTVKNISTGSLSDAVTFRFDIIKGVNL